MRTPRAASGKPRRGPPQFWRNDSSDSACANVSFSATRCCDAERCTTPRSGVVRVGITLAVSRHLRLKEAPWRNNEGRRATDAARKVREANVRRANVHKAHKDNVVRVATRGRLPNRMDVARHKVVAVPHSNAMAMGASRPALDHKANVRRARARRELGTPSAVDNAVDRAADSATAASHDVMKRAAFRHVVPRAT